MQPLQIPKMVLIRYNFKINPKQQKVTKLQNVSENEMKVTLTKGKNIMFVSEAILRVVLPRFMENGAVPRV